MAKIKRDEYVPCGKTWGTCFVRSAYQNRPHQCGENGNDRNHVHVCEHCAARP